MQKIYNDIEEVQKMLDTVQNGLDVNTHSSLNLRKLKRCIYEQSETVLKARNKLADIQEDIDDLTFLEKLKLLFNSKRNIK